MVIEIMFPQSFAVIADDDDPGLFEQAAPAQIVVQLTQHLVQISKAVVVRVAGQLQVIRGPSCNLSMRSNRRRSPGAHRCLRLSAEAGGRPGGELVGRMGIKVIEKHEKRTLVSCAAVEPAQEPAIDRSRIPSKSEAGPGRQEFFARYGASPRRDASPRTRR